MIRYVALREWTSTGIPIEPPFGHLDDIGMLLLNDNELLLSAHYFPIAIRLDGPRPSVGAIVRRDMMTRDLVTVDGRWAGAYSPILLRCFPFRFAAPAATGDPIADLEFGRVPLKTDKPRLIRMRDDEGAASKDLTILYEGVKSVWEGQQRLQPALDQLLAADLLVPIGADGDAIPKAPEIYYTIDRRRFAQWPAQSLEAMTRHSFTAIDIATVLSFSQVHLRAELRPSMTAPAKADAATATTAADNALSGGLETLTPWLDTSELFPGAWAADPSIWAVSQPTDVARAVSAPASTPPTG
ncbi:MAG: SapC family protein [Hyphomicrobiaceae bacterium]